MIIFMSLMIISILLMIILRSLMIIRALNGPISPLMIIFMSLMIISFWFDDYPREFDDYRLYGGSIDFLA